MANPTSAEAKKPLNVQENYTSHPSPKHRRQAWITQSHTRTRTYLHGDRPGTTSSMGFDGTPTVYQDWSYTDKLHLIMWHCKSDPSQHCPTMTRSKNLGTSHMDKKNKWPDQRFDRHLEPSSSHSNSSSSLSQGSTIPVLVSRIISWIWNSNSQVYENPTKGQPSLYCAGHPAGQPKAKKVGNDHSQTEAKRVIVFFK